MEIVIRNYQERDLKDLLIAWERASRIAHSFMPEAFFDEERYNIPHLYLPNADTWVGVVDDKVVGFIALIENEVGGLFVDPSYHGIGIGRALMDKAQELHGDLEVDVFKENSIGRRFYDRYGFKFLNQKIWEDTGDIIFRLAFSPK